MTPTSRHRSRAGDECDVDIKALIPGGRGVGVLRLLGDENEFSIVVPGSAPGDRLHVRLDRVYRDRAEATILEVLAPGPGRVAASCPHLREGCGGCSWQHLAYESQLSAKETVVRGCLAELAAVANVAIEPIVAADSPWFYRNKMEFTFNANDGLGLHVAGNWRRVVPITECRLESDLAMRIVTRVSRFVKDHALSSWNPDTGDGLLHELVIRHGRGTGQTMVGLVTAAGDFPEVGALAEAVVALDSSIVSVVRGVRSREQRASPMDAIITLAGQDAIIEEVSGLRFSIGLQTFFQTNTAQAERMLREVITEVEDGLAGDDVPGVVIDIFCGVGFFTLGVAARGYTTIGVEIIEASIAVARDNASLNEIHNATFYTGDARRALPQILETHGRPGVVILDPPRSGAGGKVMRRIARAEPKRIVYVSCNPVTLVVDLKELVPFGYEITRVQPIDLFPQTYHVETIVTIDRRPDAPPAVDVSRRR